MHGVVYIGRILYIWVMYFIRVSFKKPVALRGLQPIFNC